MLARAKLWYMRHDQILQSHTKLGKRGQKEVTEFKYLGTVICKHGNTAGEMLDRAVKARLILRTLLRITKKEVRVWGRERYNEERMHPRQRCNNAQ